MFFSQILLSLKVINPIISLFIIDDLVKKLIRPKIKVNFVPKR